MGAEVARRACVFLYWALGVLVLTAGCRSAPGATASPSAVAATVRPTIPRTLRPTLPSSSPTASSRVTSPVAVPTLTPTAPPTKQLTVTPIDREEKVRVALTIVYDNNRSAVGSETLRTSWGFACWVETGETTVLFDTGGDGATLMHNLTALELDPLAVDAVVLSHAHGDHTGGLDALLRAGARPVVYVPASFSRSFKDGLRASTEVVEVTGAVQIEPGVHTTGEVGGHIIEQSLVVHTDDGLIVVTGCAHPGVVNMVRRASELFDAQITLVVGGFHLGGASVPEIERAIAGLRELEVQRVAPCHCTGDTARQLFSRAFGEDCALAGVGWSAEYEFTTIP